MDAALNTNITFLFLIFIFTTFNTFFCIRTFLFIVLHSVEFWKWLQLQTVIRNQSCYLFVFILNLFAASKFELVIHLTLPTCTLVASTMHLIFLKNLTNTNPWRIPLTIIITAMYAKLKQLGLAFSLQPALILTNGPVICQLTSYDRAISVKLVSVAANKNSRVRRQIAVVMSLFMGLCGRGCVYVLFRIHTVNELFYLIRYTKQKKGRVIR